MYLKLNTKLTPDGIECSCEHVGEVATIEPVENGWLVRAYAFQQWDYNKTFESMHAAEHYALALAYEMVEGKAVKKRREEFERKLKAVGENR